MKKNIKLVLILLLGIVVLSSADCNKHPSSPDIPVFSYLNPIVNPPDTFQITYDISTYGDKVATVSFKDNAVWLVQKLGVEQVNLKVVSDTLSYLIQSKDTLGLQGGGKPYHFVVNNNNNMNYTNYLIQLTKLPLSYDSYEPKLK